MQALYLLMRSLYTNDIPGANPTVRYYEKSLLRERHLEEVARFGNKQKRIIQWYEPLDRHVEPIDKQAFPLKVSYYNPLTNDTLNHSLSSSRTVPKVVEKVTQKQFQLNKSLILSNSGRNSLQTAELDYSPYFPHKYRDYDRQYPNKWTGKRKWSDHEQLYSKLPQATSLNFPKRY